MYCSVCGEKLALVVHKSEGLVPYCKKCGEYRFPQFATAVSMVVTNRAKDAVLLARHLGQEDYILIAGYIKKGETAEISPKVTAETGKVKIDALSDTPPAVRSHLRALPADPFTFSCTFCAKSAMGS